MYDLGETVRQRVPHTLRRVSHSNAGEIEENEMSPDPRGDYIGESKISHTSHYTYRQRIEVVVGLLCMWFDEIGSAVTRLLEAWRSR